MESWWQIGEGSGFQGDKLEVWRITCAFCGEKGNFKLAFHGEKKKPNSSKGLNFDVYQCTTCTGFVHYHLALVGSAGAPKCKAGEGYVAKRDNISGTEAWSRAAETIVLLQYPKGKDTATERELSVLPRNAPAESFALVMDCGRLRLQTDQDKKQAEGNEKEIQWAQLQARLAKHDPTKVWWTLLDMTRGLAVSDSTAYRWTKDACAKDFIIEKPGRKGRHKAAQFRWNDSKTNPRWATHEDAEQMDL